MAITEVRKLPEDKQDAIAALIIKELEDERRWGQSFLSSQEPAVPASLRELVPRSGRARPASVLPVEDLRHFYAGNTSGLFRIDS